MIHNLSKIFMDYGDSNWTIGVLIGLFVVLTTPTGKPVRFLLPSLASNRTPYEYFHRLWNTGISLFE